MKRAFSMIAFAALAGAWPLAASADNAFTLRDVEIYTGPGSEYPPVASLAPNTRVDVAGCLSDWSWCDVILAGMRGWVYAGDLGYPYENRRASIVEIGPRVHIPVISFSLPAYWDAHYRGRPWYRERDVWVNRVHAQVEHGGRPPEGRAARSGPSAQAVTPAPQGRAQPPQQGQAQMPPPSYAQPREGRPSEGRAMPQEGRAMPSEVRPPEARGPENRSPENRPPEARGPENRPSAARGPEPTSQREGAPPNDRGQREEKGPQGRGGENDRNQQQ